MTQPTQYRGKAPGRVCLVGESLDWMIKGLSIVAALPLFTRVRAWASPVNGYCVATSASPVSCTRILDPRRNTHYTGAPLEHIEAALRIAQTVQDQPGLVLSISTELPVGAGVSSSAALMLATTACLQQVSGQPFTLEELCRLAYKAESLELGVGSGWMDFLACGHGGINLIDASDPTSVTPFPPTLGAFIVLIDTRERRATKGALKSKRTRWAERDPRLIEYVRIVTDVVEAMSRELKADAIDLREVGSLINEAQRALRDNMLCSTPLIDECAQRALKAGAYGAKLTGSGHGGCLFALVPADAVGRVLLELESLPVQAMVLPDVEAQGVTWRKFSAAA